MGTGPHSLAKHWGLEIALPSSLRLPAVTALTPVTLGFSERPAEGLRCSDRERDPEVHPADTGRHVLLAQQHDCSPGHQG